MNANREDDNDREIKKRIAIYSALLVLIFAYIFVIGKMGLCNNRKMSDTAGMAIMAIIFGGVLFVVIKLVYNRRLLKNTFKISLEFRKELCKRDKLLYEKSGGVVFEILLYFLLFVTGTAALINEAAFRVSFLVLIVSIVLKVVTYMIYSSKY